MPSLMEALLREVRARFDVESFNAQQLSNLLWALTVLRQCSPEARAITTLHPELISRRRASSILLPAIEVEFRPSS